MVVIKVDILEFIVRATGVGAIFIVVSILLPRRSTGVFAGYDFVFMWLFGGLAAAPLINPNVTFLQTVVAMGAVLICHLALSRIAVMNSAFARLITGKPMLLVQNGKVIRKNMRQALVPSWMLLAELRCAGLADISQVEYAILETCGRISVIPKPGLWPVTVTDMGIKPVQIATPALLMEDGRILKENLKSLNYDINWLRRELGKKGVARLEDVYVASIDGHGNIFYSYKE